MGNVVKKVVKKVGKVLGFGSSTPALPAPAAKTPAVKKAEERQAADIVKIEKKEKQQEDALVRRRQGRGTLVTGAETGIKPKAKPSATDKPSASAKIGVKKPRRRRRPRDRSSLLSGSELGIQKKHTLG